MNKRKNEATAKGTEQVGVTMGKILGYTRGGDIQFKHEGIAQAKREKDRGLANYIHLYFKKNTLSDTEFERKHLLSDFTIKQITNRIGT